MMNKRLNFRHCHFILSGMKSRYFIRCLLLPSLKRNSTLKNVLVLYLIVDCLIIYFTLIQHRYRYLNIKSENMTCLNMVKVKVY